LIPLGLLIWAFQLGSLPIWYRWADTNDVVGLFNVDSFVEALPFAAIGLGMLAVVVYLLGPLGSLSRWLANSLLAGDDEAVARTEAEKSARRHQALTIDALISTGVVLALIVIWALTSRVTSGRSGLCSRFHSSLRSPAGSCSSSNEARSLGSPAKARP
jgi:hypothetical protein